MTAIAAALSALPAPTAGLAAGRAPANVDAQLARYETQLSDWVHCPSCTTSAGKAKIAEITAEIESLKATMKQSEAAKAPDKVDPAATASGAAEAMKSLEEMRPRLRLDGQGAWVDRQA
jgi:hypothetical protein